MSRQTFILSLFVIVYFTFQLIYFPHTHFIFSSLWFFLLLFFKQKKPYFPPVLYALLAFGFSIWFVSLFHSKEETLIWFFPLFTFVFASKFKWKLDFATGVMFGYFFCILLSLANSPASYAFSFGGFDASFRNSWVLVIFGIVQARFFPAPIKVDTPPLPHPKSLLPVFHVKKERAKDIETQAKEFEKEIF